MIQTITLTEPVCLTLVSPGFSLQTLFKNLELNYGEELENVRKEKNKQVDTSKLPVLVDSSISVGCSYFNPLDFIHSKAEDNHEGMIYNPYSDKWSYL